MSDQPLPENVTRCRHCGRLTCGTVPEQPPCCHDIYPEAQPHPMLTQAVANLQALEAEMRQAVTDYQDVYKFDEAEVSQCWVDKLGTAIADLNPTT